MWPALVNPYAWLSPAGGAARLNTFIFHRVLAQPDPLMPDEPDAERFDRIVGFITRHFRVMRLSEALHALRAGRLPAAAACITFDDGYQDNLSIAAPILRRHGAVATVFIATGYIGGGRMWNDTVIEAVRVLPPGELDWRDLGLPLLQLGPLASRAPVVSALLNALKYLAPEQRLERVQEIGRRAALPDRAELMLEREGVVQLQRLGMDIGGHTLSHPILARLTHQQAADEIGGGREQLQAWLGAAPELFAYPNGVPERDYSARDVTLVRASGFQGAVSTAAGLADSRSDPFQIPRFTPWDRRLARFGARLAANLVKARLPGREAAVGSGH